MTTEKIIVGMSGGVDSSVAAMMLLEQGYRVEGLFMKNWEEDDDEDYCAAEADLADASAVCDELGIRLHTVNFASEYWDRVFRHFLDEYRAGRTPNPDILCNREIKFSAFLDHAKTLGADRIATGHYARCEKCEGSYRLLRGVDDDKDQSYFLYALDQRQLSHALFPLGTYEKPLIRQLAGEHGLVTQDKKDSTGICFIGERRFDTFLKQYIPIDPGIIVTTGGEAVGEHEGLMYYTMGQRKGLGIGGIHDADEDPWYVVGKDLAENRLIVGQGRDHPALFHDSLRCEQLHWIGDTPEDGTHCNAKVRYRQADQACRIELHDDGSATVHFDQAQRAITPGQAIVFYDNAVCLGGGTITGVYDQ